MVHKFFLDGPIKKGTLNFDGAEFHHMVRVTRHKKGDTVRLFDGTGREADAEITKTSRHSATLKVGPAETVPEETGPRLIMAVAMPKSSRAGWLVEKAVELGVTQLIPLKTERSIVDPRGSKLDSLRNNIISACKQCGRSRLMEIAPVMEWTKFLDTQLKDRITVVAHPGGVAFDQELVGSLIQKAKGQARAKKKQGKDLLIAIGPEGGFSVEEVTQAVTRGAQLVSLGPLTLRVETAALSVASIYQSVRTQV